MRKALAVFIIASLHVALSVCVLVLSFGRGMQRFDKGVAALQSVDHILDVALLILWSPFMHLAMLAPKGWVAGLWGYLPLIMNSLLWALLLVHGHSWLRRRFGSRRVASPDRRPSE